MHQRERDPGLFGPHTITWRIHREAAVLAGGQAALLAQVAHPLVAAAVAEHSGFPRDAWRRLLRTLDSGLTVVFGTGAQARAAAARVNAIHAGVRGTLPAETGRFPAGAPYHASDPELLLWVHATLVDTALRAYETFVGPLAASERERYYAESTVAAALFGLTDPPGNYADFRGCVDRMIEELAVGAAARALARRILRPPPRALAIAFAPVEIVTAGLLPERVRAAYGLRPGRAQRAVFALAARVSRAMVPRLPAPIRFVPQARAAMRRVRA